MSSIFRRRGCQDPRLRRLKLALALPLAAATYIAIKATNYTLKNPIKTPSEIHEPAPEQLCEEIAVTPLSVARENSVLYMFAQEEGEEFPLRCQWGGRTPNTAVQLEAAIESEINDSDKSKITISGIRQPDYHNPLTAAFVFDRIEVQGRTYQAIKP